MLKRRSTELRCTVSKSRSAGKPLDHPSDVVVGLQEFEFVRGHSAHAVLFAPLSTGLLVSCALGCSNLWLYAPLLTGLLVSHAFGCKYFGVQAPALSTLSVSLAFDLVAWPLYRFVTQVA